MHTTKLIFAFLTVCFVFAQTGTIYSAEKHECDQEDNFRSPRTENEKRLYSPLVTENEQTGKNTLFFPPGDLYPAYAADPFRVDFAVEPIIVTKIGIPNTSKRRIDLRAGGEIALVRTRPEKSSERGWQVSLMGGFNDQNDIGFSLDNIGWDGHYGVLVTTAREKLAYKIGLLHVSSHVGDEFEERTGRRRIGYTRQEAVAGASWFVSDHWRVYTEAGRAFFMSNRKLQQPWRTQFGLEYESPSLTAIKGISWYAAVDGQSMEERNERIDLAVQTGLVAHSTGRSLRLGVQWYNGRPPIGEFFQYTERYVSFGLWIDI